MLLTGCAGSLTNSSIAPITSPNPSTTGQTDKISWQCEQEIVNDKVVWVKCDFINKASEQAKVCIRVSYNLNTSNSQVAVSRPLCSGWLLANETHTNYASFIGTNKENLMAACSSDLASCHLSSFVSPQADR